MVTVGMLGALCEVKEDIRKNTIAGTDVILGKVWRAQHIQCGSAMQARQEAGIPTWYELCDDDKCRTKADLCDLMQLIRQPYSDDCNETLPHVPTSPHLKVLVSPKGYLANSNWVRVNGRQTPR